LAAIPVVPAFAGEALWFALRIQTALLLTSAQQFLPRRRLLLLLLLLLKQKKMLFEDLYDFQVTSLEILISWILLLARRRMKSHESPIIQATILFK
jgi:hypothetical protein